MRSIPFDETLSGIESELLLEPKIETIILYQVKYEYELRTGSRDFG